MLHREKRGNRKSGENKMTKQIKLSLTEKELDKIIEAISYLNNDLRVLNRYYVRDSEEKFGELNFNIELHNKIVTILNE